MIFSSNPSKCVWCFLTSCGSKLPLRSRGTSIGISPDSVLSVFSLVPLRELPDPRPDTACFSYPRCSAISADSAFSTNAAVSFFSNPSGPSKSSGFLYPSKSSFNTSSRIAKVPPFRQDPSSLILTYTKLRTPSAQPIQDGSTGGEARQPDPARLGQLLPGRQLRESLQPHQGRGGEEGPALCQKEPAASRLRMEEVERGSDLRAVGTLQRLPGPLLPCSVSITIGTITLEEEAGRESRVREILTHGSTSGERK